MLKFALIAGLSALLFETAAAQDVAWTRQFGTAAPDAATSMATDGAGNVYVAGYTSGSLPGQVSSGLSDAFVRRYDASGAIVWTRQFGTASDERALGVATDGAGNVYVVGWTFGTLPGQVSSGVDAFVRRYDASGAEVWTRQFGTALFAFTFASGVTTDGAGNVYVAGYTSGSLPGQVSSGSYDAYVRRYDASGAVVWTRQFGTTSSDFAGDVATDGAGNVYVAGSTFGSLPGQVSSGDSDAFVRRYDASGAEIWTRQFGSTIFDYASSVTADGAGNVSVAGDVSGSLPGQVSLGNWDAFVRRYDASGAEVWTRQFGSASADFSSGLVSDGAGNVYVAGYTGGSLSGSVSSGAYDAYVRRYDASGAVVWTRQIGSASADYASGVTADGTGAVSLAGSTSGSLPGQVSSGSDDAFVVKFSQRSCVNTTNPEGKEDGPASGTVHTLEPNVPGAANRSAVHQTNCTVVVTTEDQLSL